VPGGSPWRSYTQWAYDFARELNKPVYLLLADETTPFDPDPRKSESKTVRQLQLRYRTKVMRNRDWAPFASKDQLRAELAELRFPWEAPPPDAKPCNLPLASIGSLFKGREGFLADLQQQLGVPGARAMAIVNRLAVHGLGGVGKTRATLEYAWRRAEDYTALLFVSAPSVVELRANLANLVGVPGTTARETSVEEQLAEVLRWLEVHPGWLLIVDNVHTEEAAGEIQRLLARPRAGHVLIISRIGNWSAGVEPLELDVLAPADATGKRPPRRRYFDPSGLTGITRIMGVLNCCGDPRRGRRGRPPPAGRTAPRLRPTVRRSPSGTTGGGSHRDFSSVGEVDA
jgi:hypothetical protein